MAGAGGGQPRPRVKVRNAGFTKGKSEHSRPGTGASESGSFSLRSEVLDTITSTGSVGMEKTEVSGIGITLRMAADGVPVVQDISERGPAERNGCFSVMDRVLTIDDAPTAGRTYAEVAAMLNGSMGTSIQLELGSGAEREEEQPRRIALRRTWVPDVVWNEAGDHATPEPEAAEEGGFGTPKQTLHGVGITFKADGQGCFSVKRIAPGGPADQVRPKPRCKKQHACDGPAGAERRVGCDVIAAGGDGAGVGRDYLGRRRLDPAQVVPQVCLHDPRAARLHRPARHRAR
eukprot:185550-Rhodomonas_salina.1